MLRLNKQIKRIHFIFLLLLVSTAIKAQYQPGKDFILSGQAHYGFIIAHHNNVAHLVHGHIYGGELNYTFRTDGCKPWQQSHNYPEVGFCAVYLYLANPRELGNLTALYPFINFRLNKPEKKASFKLRLGTGLAYISKPFNRLTNPKNNIIGSHINGFVNIRLHTSITLSNAWILDAGVGLSHASNGAIETPNLGLNIATVNLGMGYTVGNKTCFYNKDTLSEYERQWHPSVIAVVGFKELETPLGAMYTVTGIQFNMYQQRNHKNSFGAGIEAAYNEATKKVWIDDSVNNPSFAQIVQVGVKAGYAFNVDRLSLPFEFGVYVFKKQDYNGLFFHRIGFRYMVTKHIMANITLLTHWAKADYFEWGIGYQF
jgi:hypothetical protein